MRFVLQSEFFMMCLVLNKFALSLYQAFCDKKYPLFGQTALNAHHADMALLYVDAIASAIKEYAIAKGTSSSLPNLDQICNDMA